MNIGVLVATALLALTGLAPVLAAAAPANSLAVADREDRFDASLLRIDEPEFMGDAVPNVRVRTADGTRNLYDLIDGKPTILLLAYYSCGHVCPLTIQHLGALDLDSATGDYRVLVLSFDPGDTLASMSRVEDTLEEIPENWTFGILPAEDNVRLTESVGFRYFFSERDQLYVHPAVLIFLSPEGEIMRYLFGSEPRSHDVELALIESRKRVPRFNELIDMVRLTCFQFDRSRSRYVLHPSVLFGSAGIGLLGLVGLATLASRKTSRGE